MRKMEKRLGMRRMLAENFISLFKDVAYGGRSLFFLKRTQSTILLTRIAGGHRISPRGEIVVMDEKRIVENIKKVRINRQMSLGQLAERSGLTKGYLSKIENSHKAPPFSTLVKVARALDVDIAFLISEDKDSKIPGDIKMCVVRANEGRGIYPKRNICDYYYESLAYKKLGKIMEPFIVMPSFDKKPHPFTHDGEEFMHILEGPFELIYGNETYILEKGDSVYFDSSVPHCGRSIGKERAKILVVLYSNKRSSLP